MKNLMLGFFKQISLNREKIKDEFVLRKELTASERLKKVKNVFCEEEFKIYSGHKNIEIGNNVYLTDALLNAGENNGRIKIEDFVFFGHRVQVLARRHNYLEFGLKRQASIIEKLILIKKGAWIGSRSIILSGVNNWCGKCSD